MNDTTTGLTTERLAELREYVESAEPMQVFGGPAAQTYVSIEKQEALALLDHITQLERERDEASAEVESITSQWRATGRAEADAHRRAEKAEAALERIKGTFFKNHLYLMMMSYPALNNPAGEALHDKIDKLIQQTIEDTHE